MDERSEERWSEARDRMLPYINAVFWQEHAIPSHAAATSVDWILDQIFKPEFFGLLRDDWTVWSQDDRGRHAVVQKGLTYEDAKATVEAFKSQGTPQAHYWMTPTTPERTTGIKVE